MAWDNYNEFSDYLSGGGMINNTGKMCYQFNEIGMPCDNQQGGTVPRNPWTHSRQSIVLREKELEPYRKNAKISDFNETKVSRLFNIAKIKYCDYLWILCLSHDDAPMWVY